MGADSVDAEFVQDGGVSLVFLQPANSAAGGSDLVGELQSTCVVEPIDVSGNTTEGTLDINLTEGWQIARESGSWDWLPGYNLHVALTAPGLPKRHPTDIDMRGYLRQRPLVPDEFWAERVRIGGRRGLFRLGGGHAAGAGAKPYSGALGKPVLLYRRPLDDLYVAVADSDGFGVDGIKLRGTTIARVIAGAITEYAGQRRIEDIELSEGSTISFGLNDDLALSRLAMGPGQSLVVDLVGKPKRIDTARMGQAPHDARPTWLQVCMASQPWATLSAFVLALAAIVKSVADILAAIHPQRPKAET